MSSKKPNRKSKIDIVTSTLTNRFKFFKKGIGDNHFLENLDKYIEELKFTKPIEINWQKESKILVGTKKKGTFISPFSWFLPEVARYGHVELILPKKETETICIHFAATGDQGFFKRRYAMAFPLATKGIASLILEIPYYGIRKPKEQFSLFLSTLSDFFKMSFGTVCEGLSLTDYCYKKNWKKIIVTGISMGGNIASFVGT
ncbi:MAG: alpha/beta hydrolase family protein, partial [Leptospiraceae bacterium]|nr:alpha/beta hydrolase family protein [Leptospiraceae bacterium]